MAGPNFNFGLQRQGRVIYHSANVKFNILVKARILHHCCQKRRNIFLGFYEHYTQSDHMAVILCIRNNNK